MEEPLPDGLLVLLHGLRARPELNTTRAVLRGWKPEIGRHAVEVAGGSCILLRPNNLTPDLESAAKIRQIYRMSPEDRLALPESARAQVDDLRNSLPEFIVAAAMAPENSSEAAERMEWRLAGAKACIVDVEARPELNGCQCEIVTRPVGRGGLFTVRMTSTGQLKQVERGHLARLDSEAAQRASTARATSQLPPSTRVPDGEDEEAMGQMVHTKNCRQLMQYVGRKGHWVCRLDSLGLIVEVVRAGKEAGPPRQSEFAFSSAGDETALKAGSLARLSAHQSNYVTILLRDLQKLCNQRVEDRGRPAGDSARALVDALGGADAAALGDGADPEVKGESKKARQKRAKQARAAEHAEQLRQEAKRQEAERVEAARREEITKRVEAARREAAAAQEAEAKREQAADSSRADAKPSTTTPREGAAAAAKSRTPSLNGIASAANAEHESTSSHRSAQEGASGGGSDSASGSEGADGSEGSCDDAPAQEEGSVEAQVRADFELAQMLSLSMDDDEESWVLQETRRREHRRTGGAEVRWGEEHASRVGLGPSADETVMRHAERAARRALKRIQQQTGRDASAPLRETTQRHVTRQAVAEAVAAANAGHDSALSEELLRVVESRVASLALESEMQKKELLRIKGQLDEAESFGETLRLWKTRTSWPLPSLSPLWTILARWAKMERRSGREALGVELERMVDCTLEQIVRAAKQSTPPWLSRHLSSILAGAVKVHFPPTTLPARTHGIALR